MTYLYGDRISDVESQALIDRLNARGTDEARRAAEVCGHVRSANRTAASATEARAVILDELVRWDGLDETSPDLARVRDRLKAPPGKKII